MGVGGIVSGAAKAVKNVAGSATQTVKEGTKRIGEGIQATKSAVADKARDTFEGAKKATTGAAKKAGEVVEAGASKLNSATDKVAEKVKKATPEAVKSAAGKAADLGKNVANAVDSKIPSGAKKALDVAGRVAGAAGTAADVITGNPKAALTGPTTIASEVLSKAGPAAGKAASRFVPGANVAAAGVDAYNFVKTLKDKDANLTDKILAGVTAGGSALGATNIPGVSQVGSVIGTAADIANNFFGTQEDKKK